MTKTPKTTIFAIAEPSSLRVDVNIEPPKPTPFNVWTWETTDKALIAQMEEAIYRYQQSQLLRSLSIDRVDREFMGLRELLKDEIAGRSGGRITLLHYEYPPIPSLGIKQRKDATLVCFINTLLELENTILHKECVEELYIELLNKKFWLVMDESCFHYIMNRKYFGANKIPYEPRQITTFRSLYHLLFLFNTILDDIHKYEKDGSIPF